MSKIPEDIEKAAEAATKGQHGWLDSALGREAIARAILAERKRCAEVARARYRGHGAGFGTERARHYEHAARAIAKAIEAGA